MRYIVIYTWQNKIKEEDKKNFEEDKKILVLDESSNQIFGII